MKYCFVSFLFIVIIGLNSCVTSKAYEDALLVGKGNHAVEGTLSRAPIQQNLIRADLSSFLNNRSVGTIGLNYIYGAYDGIDVSAGIDIPLGLHAKVKYQIPHKSLRHIHAVSFESRFPLANLAARESNGKVFLSTIPTYIYTYRHDELFNLSINSFLNTSVAESGFYVLPGIAAGIGVGNEVRFSAGVNYSRSIYASDGGQFQFLTVETSIKYDF